MNLTKRVPYRNKKITQAAEGEECTHCGRQDGTVVFAHLDELFAGKGMRQKADDCAGMFLCSGCHLWYGGPGPNQDRMSDWSTLRAYYRTIRRLIDMGVLK